MGNHPIDTKTDYISLLGKNQSNLPKRVLYCSNLKRLIIKHNRIQNLPTQLKKLGNLIFLDYSQNYLTSTPTNLWELTSLKTLYLNINYLKTLDQRLSSLTNLESLYLRKNNINTLPEAFSAFQFLKHLDLGNNILKKLPSFICSLENLTTLVLDQNRLRELPNDFNKLNNLNRLILSQNDFVEFPNEPFQNLSKLKTLDMDGCQLVEIGEGISNLIDLVTLSLCSNRISVVSEKISNLNKLESLDLTDNLLTELPNGIENLHCLKVFKISKNKFSQFPTAIFKLTNLTEILAWKSGLKTLTHNKKNINCKKKKNDKKGNKKEKNRKRNKKEKNRKRNQKEKKGEIQEEKNAIRNVKEIDLEETKLGENREETKFEEKKDETKEETKEEEQIITIEKEKEKEKEKQIGTIEKEKQTQCNFPLKEVKFFELGNNKLKELPNELFEKLQNLKKLNVQDNLITHLPDSIYEIPYLWAINVVNNPIKEISTKVQQLQNTIEINFQSTALKTIPIELYMCKNLTKLNLCNNKLQTLPKGISKLTKLTKLNLSLNKFETFPLEILKMEELNNLGLSGNKLTAIPDAITKRLYNLNELDVSNNEIYFFPKYILQYGMIKKMYFSNNNISEIPQEFFTNISEKNFSLLKIDLSHNKLTTFDSNWKNITLRELDISHNHIEKITDQAFGEKSKDLETFKVSHNNAFLDLPILSELPYLKVLHLEGNELSENLISLLNSNPNSIISNNSKSKNSNNNNNNKNNNNNNNKKKGNKMKKLFNNYTKFQLLKDLILDPKIPLNYKMGRHLYSDEKFCPRFKIGYSEMQGLRMDQEDSIAIHPKIGKNIHYFAVFDGHGGSEAANYAADKLGELLFQKMIEKSSSERKLEIESFSKTKVITIFHQVFKEFNATLKRLYKDFAGSTAVIVLIIKDKLYSINLGDSRAIAIDRKGKGIPITYDHKPTNRDEYLRIKRLRGIVTNNGRINGGLAVSRAFGDRDFQPWVSVEPTIECYDISKSDMKYLVLACDGVWDVLSNQQVADIVMKNRNKNISKIALHIRNNAYALESADNISVLVVDLLPNENNNEINIEEESNTSIEKKRKQAHQLLNYFSQYSFQLENRMESGNENVNSINVENLSLNKKKITIENKNEINLENKD
ncbi:leucine-rich repeat protein soc-2 homolog-like protein [Anaeramoeba flamelloides]|uniref:Leucine-rich repeat protein soc-2 homolog-like protein n=1 Tax=Anaeramoeba flamelloides TaxID=1746091 RepID=A0ABQ8XGK3_9EUKA|nr:leucine-rich repeat protein soc-2 homolog-like protein [Anaeramoeba flamelloides]